MLQLAVAERAQLRQSPNIPTSFFPRDSSYTILPARIFSTGLISRPRFSTPLSQHHFPNTTGSRHSHCDAPNALGASRWYGDPVISSQGLQMPLFEYQCQECDAKIEVIQRVGARALKNTECDDCGVVRPVKKLLSAPAFQFKGEGWYVTDYADKKKEQPESKSDNGSADGDSKQSSESKPAKSEKTSGDSSSSTKPKAKDSSSKSSSKDSSSSKPKSS